MKLYGFVIGSDKSVIIKENIFQIHGYSVGDRLLEGVMFNVAFKNDRILSITVDPSAVPYFSQLNTEMWLERVRKYALDILEEGDEVTVSSAIMKKYKIDGAYITT